MLFLQIFGRFHQNWVQLEFTFCRVSFPKHLPAKGYVCYTPRRPIMLECPDRGGAVWMLKKNVRIILRYHRSPTWCLWIEKFDRRSKGGASYQRESISMTLVEVEQARVPGIRWFKFRRGIIDFGFRWFYSNSKGEVRRERRRSQDSSRMGARCLKCWFTFICNQITIDLINLKCILRLMLTIANDFKWMNCHLSIYLTLQF